VHDTEQHKHSTKCEHIQIGGNVREAAAMSGISSSGGTPWANTVRVRQKPVSILARNCKEGASMNLKHPDLMPAKYYRAFDHL
jgi:hypothetical protein